MARSDTASGAVAVTPSDANNLFTANAGLATNGLYVGGAGNVKVDMQDGSTVTFNGVVAGTTLPIQVRKVYATGTTATNIIALF